MEYIHSKVFRQLNDIFESALLDDINYLVFDRGYIDRSIMLAQDKRDGRVSDNFARSLQTSLYPRKYLVHHPFLFMVSPEISLDRLAAQRIEGSVSKSEGLELRKDQTRLAQLYDDYAKLQTRERVITVDGTMDRDSILSLVFNSLGIN
jgi:thymidylate kinase